ncbi:MAG: RnfABCDGE type electron transport complex subunit D [Lentisphaeria bacterium]|nr:RnfABCDGE type electron transport complex subunit D [Lentisphaeria bacterium]
MSEETTQLILPKHEDLVVSSSPHIQVKDSVSAIMLKVVAAMIPAMAAGIYYFGISALWVILLCSIFCVGAEILWCLIAKKNVWATIRDCSALVTGILLALNLSASTPWWVCLIGAFLAIWLGKQIFGGIGYNPFNPALVARVGLLIALPGLMTTWVPTRQMVDDIRTTACAEEMQISSQFISNDDAKIIAAGDSKIDAVTCATPLGVVSTTPKSSELFSSANNFKAIDNCKANKEYFLGNIGGCLGETSSLALLIGGILLLCWRLINWRIPVFFIGTVFVITGAINYFYPGVTPSPIFHVVTGGLMLGAFFMATDMVTSPMTNSGAIVFAIGCGIITSAIRIWGNYPEGVSFSILFMNALVPFIDKFCTRRVFGAVKTAKKA